MKKMIIPITIFTLLLLFLLIYNLPTTKSSNDSITTTNENISPLDDENSTPTTISTTKKKTTQKATKKVNTTTKKNYSNSKVATGSKQEYMAYAKAYGNYNDTQMQCLDWLWTRESNWNPNSYYKGACGIPQAKPCIKIKKAKGSNTWQKQIEWGIDYIQNRYKNPCAAWNHYKNHKPHWY